MAFKVLLFIAAVSAVNAGYLGGLSSHSLDYGYAHDYATPLAYSAGLYSSDHHISSYSSPIISKTIAAAPLAYSSALDHHHYSAPLDYHYSAPIVSKSVHYSSPIIAKSYAAPDLHYSSPIIAKSYASPDLHYSSPIIAKTIATPIVAKTISAPIVAKAYSPLSYSAHLSTPLISKSLSLGAYSYPSYGYASKYGW